MRRRMGRRWLFRTTEDTHVGRSSSSGRPRCAPVALLLFPCSCVSLPLRCFAIVACLPSKVPSGVEGFFVELKRISGDPILFLKPSENTKGIRNELPSILDYPECADAASLKTMSTRHYLSRTVSVDRSYDIAIYNNPGRIERTAKFEVHVDVVRSPPLCPFNCSSHGSCSWTHDSASFECMCELGACAMYDTSLHIELFIQVMPVDGVTVDCSRSKSGTRSTGSCYRMMPFTSNGVSQIIRFSSCLRP